MAERRGGMQGITSRGAFSGGAVQSAGVSCGGGGFAAESSFEKVESRQESDVESESTVWGFGCRREVRDAQPGVPVLLGAIGEERHRLLGKFENSTFDHRRNRVMKCFLFLLVFGVRLGRVEEVEQQDVSDADGRAGSHQADHIEHVKRLEAGIEDDAEKGVHANERHHYQRGDYRPLASLGLFRFGIVRIVRSG